MPSRVRDNIYNNLLAENKEDALCSIVFGADYKKSASKPTEKGDSRPIEKKRAWIDEDDEICKVPRTRRERLTREPYQDVSTEKYETILRERFKKTLGGTVPEWASQTLPASKESLEDKIYKKVNGICSLKFNSRSHLLLSASRHYPKVSLYTIDGKDNAIVQTIELRIKSEASDVWFNVDRDEIIATSPQSPYFISHDISTGHSYRNRIASLGFKHGLSKIAISPPSTTNLMAFAVKEGTHIFLYTAGSKEQVKVFNTPSNVSSICIDRSGQYLIASDSDACIRVWDLRQHRCLAKFNDNANFSPSVINCSRGTRGNNVLAVGSECGYLNLYEMDHVLVSSGSNQKPKPFYECSNLSTKVSFVELNCDSKLVAFGSRDLELQYRMINVNARRVYQNFPGFNPSASEHGKYFERCVAFSPNSGYVAFGDHRGNIPLFKLVDYSEY